VGPRPGHTLGDRNRFSHRSWDARHRRWLHWSPAAHRWYAAEPSGTDWAPVAPDDAPADPADDDGDEADVPGGPAPEEDDGPAPPQRQLVAKPVATQGAWSPARVVVRVPQDARLELQGRPVQGTGRVRKFETPALRRGLVYTFEVRAVWEEDGGVVEVQREIEVAAGEKADIDFLDPRTAAERKPRAAAGGRARP
jgi:uncharacterized protein (TIGR03000 family)